MPILQIHLKTGLDLHYNATYKASGYLPMLRQFYFANNNTLGGYPLLDAYVSGDVKSLTFFLKMENILNSVYVQRDVVRSYSTEVYPIQPMAFRLGLLWDFLLLIEFILETLINWDRKVYSSFRNLATGISNCSRYFANRSTCN